MTDLVQRLRKMFSGFSKPMNDLLHEAADRIEQLERENAELRKDSARMQWIVGNEIDAFILLQTTSGTFIRTAIDEAIK